MADYIVQGIDELLRRFGEAGSTTTLRDAMGEAMLYIHSQVPAYPPPPPESTYQRTGTLGRTINTEVRGFGSETVGVIGSPTEYAPLVIDRQRQAWMHQDRWWTLQDTVEKARDRAVEIIQRRVMEKLG